MRDPALESRALATRIEQDKTIRLSTKRWAKKLTDQNLWPEGKSLKGFQRWMNKSFEYRELIKEWEDRYGQLMQKGHGRSLQAGGVTSPGTSAPQPGSGRVPIQTSTGENITKNMGRQVLDEKSLADLRKADIPTNQLEAFRNYVMGGNQTFETFSDEQHVRFLHTIEDADKIISEAYNDSQARSFDPELTVSAQETERRIINNTQREGVSFGGEVTTSTQPVEFGDQRLKVQGKGGPKVRPESILDVPPPSTFGERYIPENTDGFIPYAHKQQTTLSIKEATRRAEEANAAAQTGEILKVEDPSGQRRSSNVLGIEEAYDVKRGRRLARNLALGSIATVGGLGFLGSAAGAEERLKIAKQTGKWTDWTAFGLESASGVGDLLGPGGEVISTPADAALLAMDAPSMLEDLTYKPPTVKKHEAALKQEQKNAAYNNTGTAMVAARPTAGLEARAATRKQQIERQKQLEIEGEAQEAEWRRTGQAYVTRTKNPLERLRDDAINLLNFTKHFRN